ncbi:MAG: aminotransferase class I/II-fold pyridoxal phosphate-dependent enzyme, partial [Acidobacteria bacterium]|nr:aminotransferase class I/II-fold pyridoxal phosphate-dependent enzyme [Acidobacteriota bacterium]
MTAATPEDREAIYRLRHDVYSQELQQHPGNAAGRLTDALDDFNHYLVVRREGVLTGFISITPPGHGRYSLDKYFTRAELPFACDDHLFEVRLLTVLPNARGRATAALLMYAALRWVEAHGGTRIAAIGRREILNLYYRAGLQPTGLWAQSGAVAYELLHAETASLRANLDRFAPLLARLEATTKWELGIAFRQPAACFHGGRFFTAIGARFDHLTRRDEVINADVLDAWFAPSPRVVEALRACLPWLLRTSPPVQAEGLVEVIAETRGVPAECLLVGAGSSDLIFRALRAWLSPASHALLPDPTYGEYAHVLARVVGCRVARLALRRAAHYRPDLAELEAAMARGYDLVVLVNPNSPTGQFIPRRLLQPLLEAAPPTTRVWIDEAYLEYAGNDQSLEAFAARSENVMVCKSMSKVYALSGTRAAYLCAAPHQLESLRAVTPPWMVSLPGQVAAVNALQDPAYYAARHHETRQL